MRKTILVVSTLLALITMNTGCDNQNINNADTSTPTVTTANQQPVSPADSPVPQIMLHDVIYYFVGNLNSRISFDEDSYAGKISSTVPMSETPVINEQANFGAEGAPYVEAFGKISLLWDDNWAYFLTEADILSNEALINAPKTAPKLYITLSEDDTSQTVEALQLTTSWSVMYDQINGTGYYADSSGPLSIPPEHMEARTLQFDSDNCMIELQFTDDYLPDSVFVQRWNTQYVETNNDYTGGYIYGEPVPVDRLTLQTSDDGCDYIYEVHATWLPGNSYYAFRVNAKAEG